MMNAECRLGRPVLWIDQGYYAMTSEEARKLAHQLSRAAAESDVAARESMPAPCGNHSINCGGCSLSGCPHPAGVR